MNYRNLDLWITVVLAATGAAAQFGPMPQPIIGIYGLLLALFCPSYALVAALFPGRSPGLPERLATGIGLALSTAILIAAIFNWSPWGLETGVWAFMFFGITVVASMVALARRLRPTAEGAANHLIGQLRVDQLALLGAATLITVSAVVLVRTPRPVTGVLGYTMLWMVPQESPDEGFVRLGLSSSELNETQYRLIVTFNGRTLHDLADITLKPGETWERQLELPADQPHGTIEAKLYRQSTPDLVYRYVTLYID